MTAATRRYHERIAIIFDFDLTLAPDSMNALLERCGVDAKRWRSETIRPLVESGWDASLAHFCSLIQLSRSGRGPRITRALLDEVGRGIEPFPGVPEMFDRLRARARTILPELEVEFYLLSCGFVELQRATRFAHEFSAMWGSEFHFDEQDEIAFAKQVITHPEKVHYMLALSKGIGMRGPNEPADAWRPVPDDELHVPLDQVVYVGDGVSDMPAFALLNQQGGIALAVFKSERAQDWGGHAEMRPERRVENLAPADFADGAELMESLTLALESIAKRIALRRLGRGE